jgi:hypothetical protein
MSRARRRTLIRVGILLGVFGFGYWCLIGYRLPIYRYESSDRGMAELEIPWKGRDLDVVKAQFEDYRTAIGDPTVTLCRTSKRTWTAPNLWWDNITHPRWDLPYIAPSATPNLQYSTELPKLPAPESG